MERRHGIAGHQSRVDDIVVDQAPTPKARKLFPWVVFALTFGLLLSDYMSRQVLSSVFPFLKVEWALSDTQLGGLDQRRLADRRRCWPSRCPCSATAGAGQVDRPDGLDLEPGHAGLGDRGQLRAADARPRLHRRR